jgi:beta-lactamase regulating signal transducer with metallopeptidase domain
MLEGIFITIVDMSIIGGLAILLVLVVRLFLMKAPKVFSYCLWAVVLYRLVVPFSFTGPFSLIPMNKEPISMNVAQMTGVLINTGYTNVDHNVTAWLLNVAYPGDTNILPGIIASLEIAWLIGVFAMIVFGVLSLIRLRSKLRRAINLSDNIYQSDAVDTPFVLGIFRPRIYLPSTLNESELAYILFHEQNHIRRGDHIIRMISYFTLCIHWFNPLVWIAFWASSKDMEMANDEAVVRKMGESIKKDYSSSLLALSTGRRKTSPVPLAFGEADPKHRIKNIINYKKPALWVAVASIIFVIAVTTGMFLSSERNELLYNSYAPGTTEHQFIDILNSIKNPDDRMKVTTLLSTSAFGIGNSSENPDLATPTVSDEEWIHTAQRLAALSADALDQEIARQIKDTIVKNIDNPNVQWSRLFVETYVKKYAPEYYDRLIKAVETNEALNN